MDFKTVFRWSVTYKRTNDTKFDAEVCGGRNANVMKQKMRKYGRVKRQLMQRDTAKTIILFCKNTGSMSSFSLNLRALKKNTCTISYTNYTSDGTYELLYFICKCCGLSIHLVLWYDYANYPHNVWWTAMYQPSCVQQQSNFIAIKTRRNRYFILTSDSV